MLQHFAAKWTHLAIRKMHVSDVMERPRYLPTEARRFRYRQGRVQFERRCYPPVTLMCRETAGRLVRRSMMKS